MGSLAAAAAAADEEGPKPKPKPKPEPEPEPEPNPSNANTEAEIMKSARIGDIAAMARLFASNEFDATYTDDEGITPLHVRVP